MSSMGDFLSIRMEPALRRELEWFCKSQKRRPSEVARDALGRYLAVERYRALRRRALQVAEAQGLLTDEDVFRVVS